MENHNTQEFTREQWQHWRDEIDEQLREDHGWLTLIALTWLDATPRTIDAFPGRWAFDGHTITAEFDAAAGVTRDGTPLDGTERIPVDLDEFPRLECGARLAEIAPRGGRVGIRIRDNNAPLRNHFTGVPAWDYSADWVVPVDFALYDKPRTREIFTAQDGLINTMDFIGEATVELDGTIYHLAVSGDVDDPVVIFSDATGASESVPWRNAPLSRRDGQWVIDFNYSKNFPAHYTPFGTCPKPVAENVVEAAVQAGQKRPRETYAT
ncbi:MAG: DUF1684 domain-containing protein [Actinomycetaceae bacterium]|nr:DUF1684 domain-containing protein [Actinomycetaceae bacterium]